MKRGQNGFTVIETLLVLILLAILGFTGYYVYHTKGNTNSAYNSAAKSSASTATSSSRPGQLSEQTYQGDGFTLKYPMDWTLTKATSDSPNDILSPKSNASLSTPPFIYIETGSTTYTKAADDWSANGSGRAGTVDDSKTITINGYSAYYVATSFDSSKLYTYDIVHNGKSVDINLQKQDSDNASLAILERIANSIQFQ